MCVCPMSFLHLQGETWSDDISAVLGERNESRVISTFHRWGNQGPKKGGDLCQARKYQRQDSNPGLLTPKRRMEEGGGPTSVF